MNNYTSNGNEMFKGVVTNVIEAACNEEFSKIDNEFKRESQKLKDAYHAEVAKITNKFNTDTLKITNINKKRKIDVAIKYNKMALEIEEDYNRKQCFGIDELDVEAERFGSCTSFNIMILK